MVNTDIIAKQADQFKLNKDSAVEYYKQLFTKHPDVQEAYGADGIDPDAIGRSQRFVMMAQSELQFFLHLAKNVGNDRCWRGALSNFKEQFGDVDASLKLFNKLTDPFLSTVEKFGGGLSAEQKKTWQEVLAKAYADMKQWGWY